MNFDLTVGDLDLITDALDEHITRLIEDLQKEDDRGLIVPLAQDIIDCSKLSEKLSAIKNKHQESSQEKAASVEGGEADESGC